ncbi:hypothetical protein yc1106_07883 [Curvularia clavata]|uniref:NADH-ubiquinone oxidoreductase n=1 Tax=Curvularia clavata TaxID=95742 RepID=A0A9Q8ZDG1_CURCL|nr:hypothetical protein yc1106_07883 [Curvularia clavata]
MSSRQPRFNQKALIDTTPLPDDIPKVQELGASSAPLLSASYFIGARCKPYNDDYMMCKTEANGRGEFECMKEGRKVTRCAASVIKDINENCLSQFRTHWQCLENHNQQLWNCRSEERKLNKCVFDKLHTAGLGAILAMFSLPMIAPRPDASLWPSLHNPHTAFEDTQSQSPPNTSHNQRRPGSHQAPYHNQNLLLSSLTADENTIAQRKLNVRRFGAGWLRPPGVTKTLQALKDEELEKEEQEMMARREQVMMDLAAAQQEAANEEQRERGEMEEEAGLGEEERDLDDEVPEAEESMSDSSSGVDSSSADEEEEGSEVSGEAQEESTVPFNEDSFIEGSMMEAEVSHMLEMEEAEMAGVLQDERDLDDDVPEAGSYEHTDSELEDSSDLDNSALPPGLASARSRRSTRSTRRRSSGRRSSVRRSSGLPSGMMLGARPTAGRVSLGVDLGNGRSSFGIDGSSSFLDESSFLRSSPAGNAAANRGSLRDRFLGAARGGSGSGGSGGGWRA